MASKHVTFATLTMTAKVYDERITDEGRNLAPGKYILVAIPVEEANTQPTPADKQAKDAK